jgi:hypothetical protein
MEFSHGRVRNRGKFLWIVGGLFVVFLALLYGLISGESLSLTTAAPPEGNNKGQVLAKVKNLPLDQDSANPPAKDSSSKLVKKLVKPKSSTGEQLQRPSAEEIRSHMKVSLAAIYGAQKATFHELGRYTTDLKALGYLPVMEAGKKLWSVTGFLRPSSTQPSSSAEDPRTMNTKAIVPKEALSESAARLNLDEISERYCRNGCTASESGFELLSIANLDDDPDLEIWSINERKELTQLSAD